MPDHPKTPGRVWAAQIELLGGAEQLALASGVELDACYAQPHRRYHVGTHVTAVLRDAALLADQLAVRSTERACLLLAACSHDVVYQGRPGEDERASARWATDRLRAAGVGDAAADRVAELVLATAEHRADDSDPAACALLDADLAILAAPVETYDRYVSAVRFEYGHIDDAAWRAGRAAVLRSLVDRPSLFTCAPARDRWEAAARANVGRELAGLAGPA